MLKKKIKNSIILILLVIASSAMAQEIYVGTGFSSASFEDYVNSSGENTLNDSGYSKPKEPLFESGVLFNIYKEKLKFDTGLYYAKYKINTSFYSGNITIPTVYDLSYIGIKAGLKLDVIHWKKIKLQAHIHLYNDWLTYGTNSYRNEFIDLYKDKTLDRVLIGYDRGLGLEYKITEKMSCYLNYNIATSFKQENQDSTNGEEYILDARSLRIGVVINISKKTKNEVSKKISDEVLE